MRFIRKGGRVIPINDSNTNRTQYKAGIAAQNVGAAALLVGLTAPDIAKKAAMTSAAHGAGAVNMAQTARFFKSKGSVPAFQAARAQAISHARTSLAAGKLSNIVAKIPARTMKFGGAALILGGIAMTAHKIKGRKKNG